MPAAIRNCGREHPSACPDVEHNAVRRQESRQTVRESGGTIAATSSYVVDVSHSIE